MSLFNLNKKTMKTFRNLLFAFFILGIAFISYGQKSTEMFIPIGQSPGLSGTETLYGEITALSITDSTCTISTKDGDKTITLVGHPKVYLDYSKIKQRNKYGQLNDIELGRIVEMKYK